jgi:hypothetical protein
MTNAEFKAKIDALNDLILKGATLTAMEQFYDENVSMQENEEPPRVGKSACLEQEKQNLANILAMQGQLLNQAIDYVNQIVFGEWQYDFTNLQGENFRLVEVSVQHWENGFVLKEKFYYKNYQKIE